MCQLCYQATPQVSFSPIFGILTGESLSQHFTNDLPASDHVEGSDAAANSGTAYTIALGDTFEGTISSGSDDDWIAIELTAGEEIVINAFGTNGATAGIGDTTLALYNSTGTQVAYNDDAYFTDNNNPYDDNLFSIIEYTVPVTGTFYIAVSGFSSDETGDYIVRTTTDDFRIEDIVSQLTEFGWGIPTAIGHDENTGDTMYVYIANLTAAGRQLASLALEQWEVVTGITFEITGSISGADIRFDDDQSGAFAGPSSFNANTGIINFSEVNVGTGWLSSYGTTTDSYSFLTYMHEIGHALGLVHSGNYDGFANWGVNNHFNNDSTIFTIMSYFDMEETGFAPYANIITPMIADIAAVWALYGEPVSVYGGDTTWFANNTLGGLTGDIMAAHWDDASISSSIFTGGDVALTVLDTGGIDTIDLSSTTANQTIDLREGQISTVGAHGSASARNSFVIAQGTVIENVIGGSGNDDIRGNDVDNDIEGGSGDDCYYESLGNDTFDGGTGTDSVIYTIDTSGISVTDMGGGTLQVTSSLGTDTYTSVEFYEFTDGILTEAEVLALAVAGQIEGDEGPNVLVGTEDDDEIYGFGGDDEIGGFGGDDIMDGGAGNDTMLGGFGTDTLLGGAGNDVMSGEGHNDIMNGMAGDDEMHGGDGNDRMIGGDGADLMNGEGANDTMFGGFGDDEMSGGDGADVLFGQDGSDRMDGGAGNDTMLGGFGTDTLLGGAGNDVMSGEGHNDIMNGMAGDDEMHGGDGNDRMIGGDGADLMNGEGANDTMFGGFGDDEMSGGDGADVLFGQDGSDRMDGGAGNDTMLGGFGTDTLLGGAGNDVMSGEGHNDIMNGMAGDDEMHGGDGNDRMIGGDGADLMNGEGANDTMFGGFGDDEMSGGDGADVLFGQDGSDRMDGGAGNDTMLGGFGTDTLLGGAGNDVMSGEGHNDIMNGMAGDDEMYGGDGNDRMIGGDGADLMNGEGANDAMFGGIGDDEMSGGNGADVLFGQDGNDLMAGGAGKDRMLGGQGDDILSGGSGADEFIFTDYGAVDTDHILDFHSPEGDFMTLGGVAGATDVDKFNSLTISQSGFDTEITWAGGQTVVLLDYTAADLTISDFNFV
ncbi:M10 family metallopeptidase C-terminal domain-containing protein [Vannielia sp. SX4]|uniref:M10 family metallopeptidase C-terminal domain-containing protein n=1 Tax=Vannielia sp. SX4 TaxID=3463852 RepID=UPI00405A225E